MPDLPWIKSYPAGVRWDAKLPTMPLQEILEESAKKWADKPALEFMGRQINYRELNDLANRAAKGLQNLGVKPGVHVGLYLPNTPHYVIAFFGVMKAGGTVVNYSPLDAEKVLEHKVEDSGAPLPLEVQQQFQEITGCRLAEGWGMTETSPTGTFTPPKGPVKPGSCGIPMPGITIKFANVEDPTKYVPYGEKGEMAIGGPNVMKGYWKKPDATSDVMTPDGYMLTGDVGYMDEDGYIYIVDRTKDMLLCGGFNVYPRIIEEAIYKHPSVEEVSVIGIRDLYRGQSPKAFIKLKAGAPALTFEEMKNFLNDKLGKHEQLGAMEVRSELPKTAVGKLSKKELYDEETRKQAAA
jgi:long-chain acyl-CoA synthetase